VVDVSAVAGGVGDMFKGLGRVGGAMFDASPSISQMSATGGTGGGFDSSLDQMKQNQEQNMIQQMAMNQQFQEINLKTTMEKNNHDSQMAVIRNMKVSG
jgi:hypothetical protein